VGTHHFARCTGKIKKVMEEVWTLAPKARVLVVISSLGCKSDVVSLFHAVKKEVESVLQTQVFVLFYNPTTHEDVQEWTRKCTWDVIHIVAHTSTGTTPHFPSVKHPSLENFKSGEWWEDVMEVHPPVLILSCCFSKDLAVKLKQSVGLCIYSQKEVQLEAVPIYARHLYQELKRGKCIWIANTKANCEMQNFVAQAAREERFQPKGQRPVPRTADFVYSQTSGALVEAVMECELGNRAWLKSSRSDDWIQKTMNNAINFSASICWSDVESLEKRVANVRFVLADLMAWRMRNSDKDEVVKKKVESAILRAEEEEKALKVLDVLKCMREQYRLLAVPTIAEALRQEIFDLEWNLSHMRCRLDDLLNERVVCVVDRVGGFADCCCSWWESGFLWPERCVVRLRLYSGDEHVKEALLRTFGSLVKEDRIDLFLQWTSQKESNVTWIIEDFGSSPSLLLPFGHVILLYDRVREERARCVVRRGALDENSVSARHIVYRQFSYVGHSPMTASSGGETHLAQTCLLQGKEQCSWEELAQHLCKTVDGVKLKAFHKFFQEDGLVTKKKVDYFALWFGDDNLESAVCKFESLASRPWFLGFASSKCVERWFEGGNKNVGFMYGAPPSVFAIRFASVAPMYSILTWQPRVGFRKRRIEWNKGFCIDGDEKSCFASLEDIASHFVRCGFKVLEGSGWGCLNYARLFSGWCDAFFGNAAGALVEKWNLDAKRDPSCLKMELFQCKYFFGNEADENIARLCRDAPNNSGKVFCLRLSSQGNNLVLCVNDKSRGDGFHPEFSHYFKFPVTVIDSSLLELCDDSGFFGATSRPIFRTIAQIQDWLLNHSFDPLSCSKWGLPLRADLREADPEQSGTVRFEWAKQRLEETFGGALSADALIHLTQGQHLTYRK
jgi:hypothetical protein